MAPSITGQTTRCPRLNFPATADATQGGASDSLPPPSPPHLPYFHWILVKEASLAPSIRLVDDTKKATPMYNDPCFPHIRWLIYSLAAPFLLWVLFISLWHAFAIVEGLGVLSNLNSMGIFRRSYCVWFFVTCFMQGAGMPCLKFGSQCYSCGLGRSILLVFFDI